MSFYVHEVPGRLRVKTPIAKGDALKAQKIEDFVISITGVQSASVNATTGSIVLTYDASKVSSRAILDILTQKGLFNPSKALTGDQYLHNKMEKTGQVIGKALFGLFLEKAFEGTPIALLTALI
jgi:copper chaperone CopZ